MDNTKFAYFLNAVHYGIWLHEIWIGNFIHKLVFGSIRLFAKYMCSRNCQERLYAYLAMREQQLYEFKYDKKNGVYIGLSKYEFGYVYSCYPCFLSFLMFGLILKINGDITPIVMIGTLAVPIGLGYIPAYKAVFSSDRYLEYFKEFEKENRDWHRKWARITTAFCIGGVLISLLSIAAAWAILLW